MHVGNSAELIAALEQADPNQTIELASGRFEVTEPLFVDFPLTLRGQGLGTVICGELTTLFNIELEGGDKVQLSGMVLEGGAGEYGAGGIVCRGGELDLRDLLFRSNRYIGFSNEAAALFSAECQLRVSACLFVGNESEQGSCLHVEGDGSTLRLINCHFERNTHQGGSTLSLRDCREARVINCSFARNEGEAEIDSLPPLLYAVELEVANTLFWSEITPLNSARRSNLRLEFHHNLLLPGLRESLESWTIDRKKRLTLLDELDRGDISIGGETLADYLRPRLEFANQLNDNLFAGGQLTSHPVMADVLICPGETFAGAGCGSPRIFDFSRSDLFGAERPNPPSIGPVEPFN